MLSEEEVKNIFKEIDIEQVGKLKLEDLAKMLSQIGYKLYPAKIAKVLHLLPHSIFPS